MISCFYAYSTQPADVAETIETAIQIINQAGVVNVRSWKDFGTTGNFVIQEICNGIKDCELFVCDLSSLSLNVLFELGYAIATNKRIWITLDSSRKDAKSNYDRLKLLTTIGYVTYENSYEISSLFFRDQPYNTITSTIYSQMIEAIIEDNPTKPSLLYLKSEFNTNSAVELSRRLEKLSIPTIIDDPQEMASQTLSWYAQNVYNAQAVIAHLIGEGRTESKFLQNAKYALVSGMAYGFEKPLLMLVDSPYKPPVDFRHLLKIYERSSECLIIVEPWLQEVETIFLAREEIEKTRLTQIEANVAFKRINLGEPIAENERDYLTDYFIETASYSEALRSSQSMIYVGRKGSGKTANFYVLTAELSKDPRNQVCIIKPIDYELEGVLRLLNLSISRAEQGYLIASLWKFLVYTELAKSIFENIRSRPVHYTLSNNEVVFLDYVEKNRNVVLTEFSVRMGYTIERLCNIDVQENAAAYRVKVSETLHNLILSQLREHLGRLLEDKQKVCILVDNLDKAWIQREDIKVLADFIFGLLSVSRSISEEFERSSSRWKRVNLSLIVFLRSDIFSYIMQEAREVDKLTFKRIDWNDPELLKKVIEERFLYSSNRLNSPEDVWTRFFVDQIDGLKTSDYIVSKIIPRPRDIIYFCKSALSSAINRRNPKITNEDLIQAEIEYSEHAFNSLIAETTATHSYIEELLYEFAGCNHILTREQVESLLADSQLLQERSIIQVIEQLCELTFLGIETSFNKFNYLYSDSKKKVLINLARKNAKTTGIERFAINPVFHKFLGVGIEGLQEN
jgi:hypothetical protein